MSSIPVATKGARLVTRHPHLMANYARQEINIVRGEGVYLFDESGNRYIDMVAGLAVVALGHAHPRITRAVADQAGVVFSSPHQANVGNPKGDVTVVEFFDYHCGYCKRFMPEVAQLLKDDKNVRVVFKEFPILSDDSEVASRAALAVYNIDKSKYLDYHILLMQSSDSFTPEVLTANAEKVGISADDFKKAFNDPKLSKDIEDNKKLAQELAITGTPGIVIGTEFMPGAISYDKLKSTVQEVRDGQNLNKGSGEKQDD